MAYYPQQKDCHTPPSGKDDSYASQKVSTTGAKTCYNFEVAQPRENFQVCGTLLLTCSNWLVYQCVENENWVLL